MRTMEVPASKAFLLTQRSHEQAHELFKEDTSIACFENYDELISKILFYLEHEKQREKIIKQCTLAAEQYTLDKQLRLYFKRCPTIKSNGFVAS